MAEDSVRDLVKKIDKRTSDLEPVLDKLSKSLDNLAVSFSKQSGGVSSRDDLLEKFRSPFMQSVKPGGGGKESSLDVLDEIKKLLDRNHKESFPIFQSIESTLKKIEEKGGSIGGGVTDLFGGGKGGKSSKGIKSPTAGAASKAAEKGVVGKATGALGKATGALGKAARFIPGVGLAVAGGMASYDAVTAGMDAEDTLGIKDRKATFGETLSAGAGGLVEGLTMGLVSRKTAGKGIAGFFGAGPDEKAAGAQTPSTAGAIAAANLGKSPSVPMQEQDRKKAQDTFQKSLKGELPIGGKSTAPSTQTPISVSSLSSVSTPSTEPVGPIPTVSPPGEKLKEQASVKPKPSKAPKEASIKEQMEGDENLEALRRKRGELQSLYADYRDAKAEVAEQLANDIKKYPEGFVDDPSEPEYAPELKAVDDQYQPQIEALEKEVEELSKKPGIKEAQARAKAEDARFESDDFEKDDIFSDEMPEGKVKSESASVKSTSTVMNAETISTSGGGSTTTRMTEAGKKQDQEYSELEKKQREERTDLIKKLKGEGKIKGLVKFGMSQEGSPTAVPELVELEKKQKAERNAIGAKYEGQDTYEQVKIDSPPSTTTTSATVNQMSQENVDMREGGQAAQPVVINNSSAVTTSTQTFTPLRAAARPNNNSFERKQNMAASY